MARAYPGSMQIYFDSIDIEIESEEQKMFIFNAWNDIDKLLTEIAEAKQVLEEVANK